MTSSGTISNTTIDVATIVEHASRRAGISPADVTVDSLNSAKQNLYFYLSSLSNDGVNLWTIEKRVIGTAANTKSYEVGAGTLDVKNLLRRTSTFPSGGTAASSAGGVAANAFVQTLDAACTQTSPSGNISYTFASAVVVDMVGIISNGDKTYTLEFEYYDGTSWKSMASVEKKQYADKKWSFFDCTPISATQFRVRESGLGTLDLFQIAFNTTTLEIPIPRVSFDQYTNLTNKTFASEIPTQYWLDRHLDNPVINIWPMSSDNLTQLVVWRTRYIQDVGNLSNTIEVPQRWIESVITNLACRMLLELPNVDVSRYDILKMEAEAATKRAQLEERDKSPIMISPNVTCYTR